MALSVWAVYAEEIHPLTCDWCRSPVKFDLYKYMDEVVCKECLENEEAEEPEYGLTAEERNS